MNSQEFNQLMVHLTLLADEINEKIPFVNNGGCGMVALLVAKELNRAGIETTIVISGDSDFDETYNIDLNEINKSITGTKPSVSKWNKKDIYFAHVCIEFNYKNIPYHFESEKGLVVAKKRLMGYKIYKGRLSIEVFEPIAENPSGWNKCFERNHIPFMKEIVKNHLSKIHCNEFA